MPVHLGQPLADAPGIRPALAKALHDAFGYRTVRDLLEHYPRRYVTRGGLTDLGHAKKGANVTVVGQVRSASRRQVRRNLRLFEVRVSDGRGVVTCTWFNQPWHAQKLPKGTLVAVSGVLQWKAGKLTMSNPDYEVLSEVEDADDFADQIIPVYPATKDVSSGRIRRAISILLDRAGELPELLPETVRRTHGLISRTQAMRHIHRPPDQDATAAARRRLVYEELFLLQMGLALRRHAETDQQRGQPLDTDGPLTKALLDRVPFTPTRAQTRVISEIARDLRSPQPMHRLLQGEVGSGKAAPLDSLVLTPAGFKRMGDISVGDEVITPSGEISFVTGVYPQGVRDVWRLVLSDGTSVECDDEHLWAVNTDVRRHRGHPLKVLTTRQIREDLTKGNGVSKWHLPVVKAADLEGGEDRPLDPYLLGVLLGDGSLGRNPGLTSADPQIVEAVQVALPSGCWLQPMGKGNPYDDNIRNPIEDKFRPHPVRRALTRLGLRGLRARDKHVPSAYLNAPVKVRHAVLQGLLDTDGTLDSKRGSDVSFTSASERLARDVQWLVQSLGGVGRLRPVTKVGRTYYRVSIKLPNEFPPFRLTRKSDLFKPRTRYRNFGRAIRAVEYVGRKPVQCISIAHPDQLYVTDHFIVTHNTLVALWALLCAVQSGGQGALMAPTEVLADQHFLNLSGLLARLGDTPGGTGGLFGGPRIEVLTASVTGRTRQRILEQTASGEVDLLVGTHALLSEGVAFKNLAMVVADEQHRFGVRQRVQLREKGNSPHVLIMTATPIPRTLALTLYGDLDVSILDELPPGRTPVATHVVSTPDLRERAYQRVREEVARGHQAYVVCALKDESESPEIRALAVRSAKSEAERLRTEVFPDLRVGLVYGDMPPREKEAAMEAFREGRTDVLVSTTVVEVGVDVPNATVMLVEDADRFGLSQLHQLRGRVGRGRAPGLAILFADPTTDEGRARMEAIASSNDGFWLADQDLRIRGEGTVFDARQSGLSDLKIARLVEDMEWVPKARQDAFALVQADPQLRDPAHAALRAELTTRFAAGRAEWLARG